jgi:hypothetical protein
MRNIRQPLECQMKYPKELIIKTLTYYYNGMSYQNINQTFNDQAWKSKDGLFGKVNRNHFSNPKFHGSTSSDSIRPYTNAIVA